MSDFNSSSIDDRQASNVSDNGSSESRRNFLRTQLATAAVVGCALPAANGTASAADESTEQEPSSDRVLRIALVGCGGRGTGAMNDSLSINENIEFVAAADLELKNCQRAAKAMAKRHGDKVTITEDKMHSGLDGYKQVLADPDVDIVMFATSPGFRPRHVAEAVEAGKHVFAEKPSCVDPAGYRICLDAHKKAVLQGTAIVTGTQYRRQTNYIAAIEKIREGAIGDVVSATSRYCTNGIWYRNRSDGMSNLDFQLKNWMHFIWLSGDQICEQAVHNIDLMNWVMDSVPEKAFASGGRFARPEESEMWDAMSVDYHYPGDRVISFKCRHWPGSDSDNGTIIYGTKANMHIGSMSSGSKIVDKEGNETWSSAGKISDAYEQEHKDLVDSIRAGKPIVELEETANSSLTAVMGRLAAYTGKRVDWKFVSEESSLDLFPKDLSESSELTSDGYAVPGKTKLI